MLSQALAAPPLYWQPTLDQIERPISLVQLNEQFPADSGFLFNLQDRPSSNWMLLQNLNFIDLVNYSQKHYIEEDMTFRQQVEAQGLLFEQHQVTTDDGYILTVHRIKARTTQRGARVLFLQHGIFSRAETWISNTPEHAVAYILANAGYDVFLGNSRGNYYSSNHVGMSANANPREFFDYSFQKQGDYDVPAQINKALEVSGVQKLSYIGHSQGTT